MQRGRVDLGAKRAEPTPPKTRPGRRTLPLTPELAAAYRRTRALLQQEHLKYWAPWDEDAYLLVDEGLRPTRPARYGELWKPMLRAAAVVKPVTLHGALHGTATRMLDSRVPIHIVAAWHGQDPTVTMSSYAHGDNLAALQQAAAALSPALGGRC